MRGPKSVAAWQVAFFAGAVGLLIVVQSPLCLWILQTIATSEQARLWTLTLRSNTPGIVIALIIAFYIDVIRAKTVELQQEETLTKFERRFGDLERTMRLEPLRRAEPSELLESAFQAALGNIPHVEGFKEVVLDQIERSPLLDMSLEFTLKDSAAGDLFFDVDLSIKWRNAAKRCVIAVIGGDQSLMESFSYNVKGIDETVYVGDPGALDDAFSVMRETFSISYQPDIHFTAESKVKLREVSAAEIKDLTSFVWDGDASLIRFLYADIPPSKDKVTLSGTIRIPDRNYFYWQLPRLSYVNDFIFDARGFRTTLPISFDVTPFLGCTSDLSSRWQRQYRVNINNWIVKGQGVMLTWHQTPSVPPTS
jgi:hypothetical protein